MYSSLSTTVAQLLVGVRRRRSNFANGATSSLAPQGRGRTSQRVASATMRRSRARRVRVRGALRGARVAPWRARSSPRRPRPEARPERPRRSDVARAAHLRGDVSRAAPDRLVDVDVDPRVASIDPAEGGDLADLPPPDSGAIPKVIHLLWKTDELPEFAREFVHSWVRLHPSWQVRRWTDASMLAFVRAHFPGDEAMWRRFPTGVFRADTFRYMVLRVVGGVYVDLDVEALRSMDELIEGRTCLIGQEPAAHAVLLGDRPRHACNAWMASAPGGAVLGSRVGGDRRRAEGRMNKFNPPSVTGPEMLDAVLERTGYASPGGCGLVDPPEVLYPAVDKSALATLREK